jgi:hypothetical protein
VGNRRQLFGNSIVRGEPARAQLCRALFLLPLHFRKEHHLADGGYLPQRLFRPDVVVDPDVLPPFFVRQPERAQHRPVAFLVHADVRDDNRARRLFADKRRYLAGDGVHFFNAIVGEDDFAARERNFQYGGRKDSVDILLV